MKRAELIYDVALKNICEMIGKKTETNSDELDLLGKKLFQRKWSGVYPSDIKPDFIDGKMYAIVNLDPSWSSGSHWVALIKDGNESKVLSYDSFGRPMKTLLPGKGYKDTELDAEQGIKESSCGQRSMTAIFIFDQFGRDMFLQL